MTWWNYAILHVLYQLFFCFPEI